MSTHVYNSNEELAYALSENFVQQAEEKRMLKKNFFVAIPGGNTPKFFFEYLSRHYKNKVDWSMIHFFWVDERCVPPDNPESNYRMAYLALLNKILIPGRNIHRIKGENLPENEMIRYTNELIKEVPSDHDLPSFDLIYLGMGEDGHVASIFPNQKQFLKSYNLCEMAIHPESLQKRVTLTGKIINNAQKIIFIVTGNNKAEKIKKIITHSPEADHFPAYFIKPHTGETEWYLDKAAAGLLD